MKTTTVGIDLAKNVFQIHGVSETGKQVMNKPLKRKEVLPYFAQLPACLIGMESCGSAHYWQRELSKLGHDVKLINPAYVTPFVKRNKSDARDAEAICEVVARPCTPFVPNKSVEQQDIQMLHRIRSQAIKQRTAQSNQIRGLLAEYGLIIPLGIASVRRRLPEILEDAENDLSMLSREMFSDLYDQLIQLDNRVKQYDKKLVATMKNSDAYHRLQAIPGVGPLIASALLMAVGDAKLFKNGRHLAAYLGLVPKQHSSGGKERLLGISKRGDRYLRSLLIHGARAVGYRVKNDPNHANQWFYQLIQRRGFNKAVVAMANKMARQAWVILAREEEYKPCV